MKDVTPNSATPQALAALASRFLDVAAMPWHEPFPGLRMKVLYKDDEAKEATILFETQPGTVIPEHVHGGVEWSGRSCSKARWRTPKASVRRGTL